MKYLVLFAFIPAIFAGPKTLSMLKLSLNRYSQKELSLELKGFIRASRPNRFVGQPGHKKAVDYIINEISDDDTSVGSKAEIRVQSFSPDIAWAKNMYEEDFKKQVSSKFPPTHTTYRKWRKFTDDIQQSLDKFRPIKGRNIIWEKKGLNEKEVLIVGAHFDNIIRDPRSYKIKETAAGDGANGNGAAVAVAIALIKKLKKLSLKRTVRVIFFDYEELGFLGSQAYVKNELSSKAARAQIVGLINLEMIGQDTVHLDKAKKFGNMHAYIRRPTEAGANADRKFARQIYNYGKRLNNKINFKLIQNSWDRSDHINFWRYGVPAITFTQNWDEDFNNNLYHTSADIMETLNFNTLYNGFQFIGGAVIAWALKL